MAHQVRRALWDKVPRDHREAPAVLRRRQWVVVGFVLAGAVTLGFGLRTAPGSRAFYALTLVVAGIWVVGAFASGPLHLGRIHWREDLRRPTFTPFVVGIAMVLLFVGGGFLVRSIPFLDPLTHQIQDVLGYTASSPLWALALITAINGAAEELFFRGAAYAAIPWHPVSWTTLAYVVATLATGNVMLTFAAVLLGFVVGLERRASGGIQAPIITHLTWSLSMLVVLPWIFL
ncbi:CPBP family intramembrane metalloprotease [Nocardioides sp. CBS4Y-1]|uniref:CPBP family intramembrane metalloprotease n=1 Tax=Nocardioides acrostichi TaxID=2784339 RepID=A0A930UZ82_9ACTN|nr:CPBP family intramembrane metalloprotease [Nocardioides acrostichi]